MYTNTHIYIWNIHMFTSPNTLLLLLFWTVICLVKNEKNIYIFKFFLHLFLSNALFCGYLFGPEFLTYIIFFSSKGFLLTFIEKLVYWQLIPLIFYQRKYFSFTFEIYFWGTEILVGSFPVCHFKYYSLLSSWLNGF